MNFPIRDVWERSPQLVELLGRFATLHGDSMELETGREISDGQVHVTLHERFRRSFEMSMWVPVGSVLPIPRSIGLAYEMLLPMGVTLLNAFEPHALDDTKEMLALNRYFNHQVLVYSNEEIIYVSKYGAVNKSRRWTYELPDAERQLHEWTPKLRKELDRLGLDHSSVALSMYLESSGVRG